MSRIANCARPSSRLRSAGASAVGGRMPQRDALGLVEAALSCEVDPGIDGPGPGVERDRRAGVRPVLAAARAAREGERGREGEDERDAGAAGHRRARMPAAPVPGRSGGPAPALRHRGGTGRRSRLGRLLPMRRRVTFSRNVTLSLSRTCVSHCKYCAFATHRPHLHEPDEVERAARPRRAARRQGAARPDRRRPGAPCRASRERLAALGFEDFVAYVVWCCERALERGLLPHTNLGALARDDLARLREVTASQGLMLESMRAGPRRASGLADEGPGAAAADDPRRGRAADPVHERDPRRDRRDARRTASPRSRRWPRSTPSTATCRR